MVSTTQDKKIRLAVLAALADGTRADIVQMLAAREHTAGEIHRAFRLPAPAVSRHLRVLREAGLVDERHPPDDRRVRVYSLRTEPLTDLDAWLDELTRTWQAQLDSFRDYVALRKKRPRAKS